MKLESAAGGEGLLKMERQRANKNTQLCYLQAYKPYEVQDFLTG